MKKSLILLTAAAITLGMSSCGDDAVLDSSSAKKALKKEAFLDKDYATVVFKTGYYEVSESEMLDLKRLSAAGMITLSPESIVEKTTRRNYSYYSGYTYETIDVEHLFAAVELTEAGKKLEVAEPVTERSDIRKDFAANKGYVEEIPNYMNISDAELDGYLDATDSVAAEPDSVVAEAEVEVVEVVEESAPAAGTSRNTDPNAAYNAAVAKINTSEHHMLLGRYQLLKVRQVRCTEEMANNGVGECRALITFRDKTPFGFVLGAPKQDYIESINVSFAYYQDMGWTVSKTN